MRAMLWVVMLAGCGGGGACALAEDHQECPECYSGEVTCTYGGYEATAGSCGDCQARAALYQALCDARVGDTREDIEAGTECSDPDTGGGGG